MNTKIERKLEDEDNIREQELQEAELQEYLELQSEHTKYAYKRGFHFGIILAVLVAIVWGYIGWKYEERKLADEAKATNYYYNLTK